MVPSMVRLGARVSLVPDRGSSAYGAPLITYHDAEGHETKREYRGRELELLDIVLFVDLDDRERVATRPGESTLAARLPWSADQVRDEVRRIVYDDGDRQPRWLGLMAGLEARGVHAGDAALDALPLELAFDDLVLARYGE